MNIIAKMQNTKFVENYNMLAYNFHMTATGNEKAAQKLFFFHQGFLLRTFMNHRTAEEGAGHFFNSLAGRLLQTAHLCT